MEMQTLITIKLIVSIAFAAATAGVGAAEAQEWPTRPVTMVVPFAAGGPTDVVGRIFAGRVSELLGKQIIVENVVGAGGMTGSYRVAKAAPDGYQFGIGNVGTHAQNQSLYKNPLYNAATDFAHVGLVFEAPIVLVTRMDFPANNLQDFIAYTKANQAKVQFGSAGAGSATHLACALLNAAIGVKITHVPYRGAGPAMQDLVAGRVDYECHGTEIALQQIENKTIKAIAVLSANRSPTLPELRTVQEQGLMGFDATVWSGFFLPKGAPAAIMQKLHDATVTAMDTPAVQDRLKVLGAMVVVPERRSSEYLERFVEKEIERWAGTIKAAGISAD